MERAAFAGLCLGAAYVVWTAWVYAWQECGPLAITLIAAICFLQSIRCSKEL